MKVISNNPLPIECLNEFTGGNGALYTSQTFGKIRIMHFAGNIETEVDRIVRLQGRRFGLRKMTANDEYDYIGFLIK